MGIDLKGSREKSATAAAETETDADLKSEEDPEGDAGVIWEGEESQRASGSSGSEWSRAEDD